MDLSTLLSKARTKLEGVHPFLQEKALQLIAKAYDNKVNIIISQGLRTIAEQNELYAQGRTKLYDSNGKKLPKVTWAKGGTSYHNYGLAFDVAILLPNGKIDWDDEKTYRKIGQWGKNLGLQWGGDFPDGKTDLPHFQYKFGLEIKDLLAGKKPPAYTAKPVEEAKEPVKQPVKEPVKEEPKTQGGRKMELQAGDLKRLGDAYKNLFNKGYLSSNEWADKAYKGTLTIDDATYVNALVLSRVADVQKGDK